VEEKYQKSEKPVKGQYGDKYDEDSESSNDEDEDSDGFLATEDLDAEISATLQAIRSKDPRVYDEKISFYKPIEEDENTDSAAVKKEKPMYLRDYHRENLLKGNITAEDDEEAAPRTFAQEQEDLQKDIIKQMHAAVEDSSSDGDDDDDRGFLVPKSKSKPKATNDGVHPSRASKVTVDVAVADKDPDTFLSNFMSARAWVPSEGTGYQPLESEDEEENERAEKWEAAYNLRFEDPNASNELLKSYARDVIAKKSVRREETKGRKKQRDAQRERKEAEKAEREEERAQLRRLKIGEMEEKLQKIKKAAGIKGKTLKQEEWTKFLEEGYDDDKWEAEFTKHFGDDYYAEQEVGSESDADVGGGASKKKIKKPKWDDDIDIKDLIPEFEEEENSQSRPAFTLSDSEEENDDEETPRKSKSSKTRQQEKQAKKKAARIERKKIEDLVDSHLDLDMPLKSKQPALFRYRETSPTSFGLTARDILMAPDSSLNQFAGLKKMAAFRDADKKRKDKKHLGKKARLRQWRKETFGNEDGPEIIIGANAGEAMDVDDEVNIVEGKKKKRSRKGKAKIEV
jgi:protein KRI1